MTFTISASSYDRWWQCPRLYYWEYVVRLKRAREDGARRFGTMFHAGLESWWRAMDGGDVPWRNADAAFVAAMQAVAENARHVETDPFEVARAEAMITAYHVKNLELDFTSVIEGGGVEHYFRMPLRDEAGRFINHWEVIGRLDVIKQFADGRNKPVEHKTTAQEIHLGADYWKRLSVDTQASIYVDAARFIGFPDTRETFYDVARKPELRPGLKTPEEKRRYTKGKGCPHCGGKSRPVARGSGRIIILSDVDGDGRPFGRKVEVEVDCTSCAGTGWHEAPRLDKKQRTEDESVEDYKARVAEELADDFDAYFRMASIPRDAAAIAESRANLVTTTGIIGAMVALAHDRSNGNLGMLEARRVFAQNTNACLAIYGAPCSFLPVCKGAVSPADTRLYRIKARREVPT